MRIANGTQRDVVLAGVFDQGGQIVIPDCSRFITGSPLRHPQPKSQVVPQILGGS